MVDLKSVPFSEALRVGIWHEYISNVTVITVLLDDDSGDETSKMSAAGAGANDDSWGDDTDISLAPDDKKNKVTE